MKPVCLVLGAGAGIGGTVAAKFVKEGYHSYLCRRSEQEGLDRLIGNIKEAGGEASGCLMNAIEENSIEETITMIEKDIGPIEVLVYNLGAQTGMKLLDQTSYKEFEWGWRMASFGLFRAAKVLCPLMVERGKGNILVTSATAAMRGNKNQHSHAAAMGARRMLCQSLNAEFGRQGIHVAHFIIDGAIDTPFIKENFPDTYALKEKDGILQPKEIAEAYWSVHAQHPSAWTQEMDLRPYMEKF